MLFISDSKVILKLRCSNVFTKCRTYYVISFRWVKIANRTLIKMFILMFMNSRSLLGSSTNYVVFYYGFVVGGWVSNILVLRTIFQSSALGFPTFLATFAVSWITEYNCWVLEASKILIMLSLTVMGGRLWAQPATYRLWDFNAGKISFLFIQPAVLPRLVCSPRLVRPPE